MATDHRSIVEGCRAGDRAAADEFVRLFQPLVIRRLRFLRVPSADAPDVCQDVLIAAITQLASRKFEERASLATWVQWIVFGKACDYWRRRERRRVVEADAAADQTRPDQEAAWHWAPQEIDLIVAETLRAMPRRQAIACRRYFVEDASVETVAGEIERSVSRTRGLLTGGKTRLTRALRDHVVARSKTSSESPGSQGPRVPGTN